jgi:sec-independent protein translocase protein TatC
MALLFAFGIVFQLPVILTLLARADLISAGSLRQKRKHAILIAFVVGAILTPPDPISQLGLALPILALYELSIHAVGIVERRRAAARARRDAGSVF